MSEVLAQLEKKGGGSGGEQYTTGYSIEGSAAFNGLSGKTVAWASLTSAGFDKGYLFFGAGFSNGNACSVLIEFDATNKTITVIENNVVSGSGSPYVTVAANSSGIAFSTNINLKGSYVVFS